MNSIRPVAAQRHPGPKATTALSAHTSEHGGARPTRGHHTRALCGGAASGGPSVDGRRRGSRVEHRWRGVRLLGNVKGAVTNRSGVMTVRQRRNFGAVAFGQRRGALVADDDQR
jgi:hypothetical protein